jgi:hypothetical protein
MNQEQIDKLPGAYLEANSTKDSNPRHSPGLMARPGRTIAKQSEGRTALDHMAVMDENESPIEVQVTKN